MQLALGVLNDSHAPGGERAVAEIAYASVCNQARVVGGVPGTFTFVGNLATTAPSDK